MPKRKMKAQMFLITMIFLAGLVFFVQQLLFQYTFLDASSPLERNDIYVLNNIKDMTNQSLVANDCNEAEENLQELDLFFKRQDIKTYLLDLRYNGLEEPNLDCGNWGGVNPVLTLQIRLISSETDTTSVYDFYA